MAAPKKRIVLLPGANMGIILVSHWRPLCLLIRLAELFPLHCMSLLWFELSWHLGCFSMLNGSVLFGISTIGWTPVLYSSVVLATFTRSNFLWWRVTGVRTLLSEFFESMARCIWDSIHHLLRINSDGCICQHIFFAFIVFWWALCYPNLKCIHITFFYDQSRIFM